MQIAAYSIETPIALSPMAGITDKPFRQIARQFGVGYAVSEMITDDPSLRYTRKTLHRSNFANEQGIRVVQIAGSQPEQLAQAARYNVEQGAEIIDINMGCPVKKVCNVLAGSALLQNEQLVNQILHAVCKAVDVPVTLKTRLGFCEQNKNILTIAKMAEQAGIAALAVHGRTREQMYRGDASYDLIAQVKQNIDIPLWANGDIDSPQKAAWVLSQTGADGVMIGRAAQGQPWLFADVKHYLQHACLPDAISVQTAGEVILQHLQAMYEFYGEVMGVRIARKHIAWYIQALPNADIFRKIVNKIENATEQYDTVADFLNQHKHMIFPCAYRDEQGKAITIDEMVY